MESTFLDAFKDNPLIFASSVLLAVAGLALGLVGVRVIAGALPLLLSGAALAIRVVKRKPK